MRKKVCDYLELEDIKNFKNIKDLYTRGTAIAWAGLFMNFVVGIFVATGVWYFVAVLLVRTFTIEDNKSIIGKIITEKTFANFWFIYTLLIFWVPMRLYSSWYINFYEMPRLDSYYIFVFLLVIAIIIGVFLTFHTMTPKKAKITFGGVSAALGTLVTIIAIFDRGNKMMNGIFYTFMKQPFWPNFCIIVFVALNAFIPSVLFFMKDNLFANE